MNADIDHIVIGCARLEQGVAWCEARFGVTPGPGGRHALMSTHNRLLAIGAPHAPRAYLELIAIDPEAPPPGRPRWFGLDEPAVRAAMAQEPQLLHWVAGVGDVDAAVAEWQRLGLDPGPVLEAERDTPKGMLRWRLTVRDDGARLLGGALPTLIQWGPVHPADAMPASGVTLDSLTLGGGDSPALGQALHAVGAGGFELRSGLPALRATFQTPRGEVVLASTV